MANFITTNFSHTYNGQEFLSELFYTPEEDSDNIFANYRVMGDIKTKRNIYLPGALQKVLKKSTTCGFSATADSLSITDKTIDVEKLKVNLEECVDAIFDTIFEESVKAGVDIDDLEDHIVAEIARRQVVNAIRKDVGRIQWFAKSGASSDDYDQFDGWIQLMLDSSANLGEIVDLNTTSFESGGDLATDGARDAMKQIWENRSAELRDLGRENVIFYVSDPVFDNLMCTYEDLRTDSGLMMQMDGKPGLKFRGIPVVEVPGWTTHLADSDNPQNAVIGKNLIVLTTPDNLIVGSDITDPSAQLKFRFNDDDDELMKIISKFKLGAQIVHPVLASLYY